MHYDFEGGQHRLISQREAARLQSFPDSFEFLGSRTQVNKQIGNAVPPLLAFQIANSLGTGVFVDLFSGAGGLSLGFHWAGWKSLIASDVDAPSLRTYSANFGSPVLQGDLDDIEFRKVLQTRVIEERSRHPAGSRFFVVGGPPCQGFSTAGNARSMDDARNHLFRSYADMLNRIRPDGFVFENVLGLLSMKGGLVYEEVQAVLSEVGYRLSAFKFAAEQHGVPQRRSRIVLIGQRPNVAAEPLVPHLTSFSRRGGERHAKPSVLGVADALEDLPRLTHGEDGSHLTYRHGAENPYQALMRGLISPDEYIRNLGVVT